MRIWSISLTRHLSRTNLPSEIHRFGNQRNDLLDAPLLGVNVARQVLPKLKEIWNGHGDKQAPANEIDGGEKQAICWFWVSVIQHFRYCC
mmetsp:Transcript_2946/g.4434  ORF Transcript_2946/g.4434 Transcript_2946/m.4434 type:complete len:90 (-) Transcript_2946:388-657(-)